MTVNIRSILKNDKLYNDYIYFIPCCKNCYEEALKNKKFIIVEKKSDFCNAPLLAVFATESQFSEVYPGKEELYKAATFTNIFGKEEKGLRKTVRD